MDIRRIIITAVILVTSMVNVAAQNRIDEMIENYSSRGTSRFTSAVERDPKTRKVVNVLELNQMGIHEFRGESKKGNFTEKRTESSLTLMLTVRDERQNRIYMMHCTDPYTPYRKNTHYGQAKITVIIKYG